MRYPVPFGRHLLLERINVGGMAEVFKAKAFGVEGFERIVAVKRILPTMAEDDEFITMFVDEARIASHLTHQNIVQIYELGKAEGSYFISMEYVAGRDLRQILDHHKRLKKPMDVAKACFIASRVCEALEYAHKKKDPAGKDLKIIHRDVSPQNVIISFEGEVKLCDFGIAKAVTRASRTQVGVLKGKFAYMSPEQVRGQPTDRRSDLFALGVIFYEMLTGERLFLGESDYSTLESVRNARVPAPTQYNAKIPESLEKIMMRLLARDPKDRYQWAWEVHEDLLDHLVSDGKIFHGRHLRNWMQEVYARDIEIENAKLEEFMRLKLAEGVVQIEEEPKARTPSPSPVVVEMAEGAGLAEPKDPAMSVAPEETDSPQHTLPETGSPPAAAQTADLGETVQGPDEPASEGEVETSTVDRPEDLRTDQLEGGMVKAGVGTSPAPELASPSPVSSLFGTPQLDGEKNVDHDDAIVRPAIGKSSGEDGDEHPAVAQDQVDDTYIPERALDANPTLMSDHEPEDPERTQCDLQARSDVSDGNDTVFDNPNESGETPAPKSSLEEEIRQAQSELIDRLGVADVLDTSETVDANASSEEFPSPFVLDPSEGSDTSESPMPGFATAGSHADGATSVSPLILDEETPEAALDAATSTRTLNAKSSDDFDPENGTIEAEQEHIAPNDKTPAVPQKVPGAGRGRAKERGSKRRSDGQNGVDQAAKKEPSGPRSTPQPGVASKRRIWEISREDMKGDDAAEERSRGVPGSEGQVRSRHAAGVPRDPAMEAGRAAAAPQAQPETTGPRAMPAEEAMSLLPPGTAGSSIALRDPRVLMLVAGAVGMLAIALLVTLIVTRASSGASLHINTDPVRTVQVILDGKVIASRTPVDATSLRLGRHKVELRAPGFHDYTQEVNIVEAKPHTMVVPLERTSGSEALEPPKSPEDPAKARRPPPADEPQKLREPELPPGEDPSPDEPPAAGSLPKKRDEAAHPLSPEEPEPKPKRKPEAPASPPSTRPSNNNSGAAASAPPKSPKSEEGYLVVSTKPSGVNVLIDGKDTGLRTPLRHPYGLPAGKHILMFEMPDGQKYSFDLEIVAGETKKLVKTLR